MKTCMRCQVSKALPEHFYKNRRKPDGYDIYCKACCKLQQSASYVKRESREPGITTRRNREWRTKNPEKALAYQRQWVAANRERVRCYWLADYWNNREARLAADKARREANIDLYLERERVSMEKRLPQKLAGVKAWQKANPAKVRATASKRRSAIRKRLPAWLTLDDFSAIEAFYQLAARMQKETGIEHHVDHILPLQGRYVSGLHVPANLQVLTAKQNLSKNNRWTPE